VHGIGSFKRENETRPYEARLPSALGICSLDKSLLLQVCDAIENNED
jgi:hypothetical protein